MSFIFTNPNQKGIYTIDCVIRAISLATDSSWDETFVDVFIQAYLNKDMPSSNKVWADYLKYRGFKRFIIPSTCPDCYTVIDFCRDHPDGVYILGTGSHVIAVRDGDYYDTWDSGNELPLYYWKKETLGNELPFNEQLRSNTAAIPTYVLPESAGIAATSTATDSNNQNE